MHRCLQLARLALGQVAPNPVVGAVLVYGDRIIGEGYHQQFGGPHAEVSCLASVKEEDREHIAQSTLYVSLEPCAHFGKTPPCADLILRHNIRRVVVGCRDPFPLVDGKGIEKLQAAGVAVTVGVLEEECKALNKRFFTFHTRRRPWVLLKWAQSADGKIAGSGAARLHISNAFVNRQVHKWRSREAGIVVGTNTALADDPELTVRLWPGRHPVRVVVDTDLRLPATLKLFDARVPTIVFNKHRHTLPFEKGVPQQLSGVQYYAITEDVSLVQQMLNGLHHLGIQSLLVEGGARLLQSFIEEGVWDEARVITNENLIVGAGLPAPKLFNQELLQTAQFDENRVHWYRSGQ